LRAIEIFVLITYLPPSQPSPRGERAVPGKTSYIANLRAGYLFHLGGNKKGGVLESRII
jgi:hypothetical protein